jgi:hypothetical protein
MSVVDTPPISVDDIGITDTSTPRPPLLRGVVDFFTGKNPIRTENTVNHEIEIPFRTVLMFTIAVVIFFLLTKIFKTKK